MIFMIPIVLLQKVVLRGRSPAFNDSTVLMPGIRKISSSRRIAWRTAHQIYTTYHREIFMLKKKLFIPPIKHTLYCVDKAGNEMTKEREWRPAKALFSLRHANRIIFRNPAKLITLPRYHSTLSAKKHKRTNIQPIRK